MPVIGSSHICIYYMKYVTSRQFVCWLIYCNMNVIIIIIMCHFRQRESNRGIWLVVFVLHNLRDSCLAYVECRSNYRLLCCLYGVGCNDFDIHYKGHWRVWALKIETFLKWQRQNKLKPPLIHECTYSATCTANWHKRLPFQFQSADTHTKLDNDTHGVLFGTTILGLVLYLHEGSNSVSLKEF
jgi:hypothetical protein